MLLCAPAAPSMAGRMSLRGEREPASCQVCGDLFVRVSLSGHSDDGFFDLFGTGKLLEATDRNGNDLFSDISAAPDDPHLHLVVVSL